MKTLEALQRFTDLLNREEIPYLVVGSFSSNFHGIPRSTKDADLVLEFDSETWSKLSAELPAEVTRDITGKILLKRKGQERTLEALDAAE